MVRAPVPSDGTGRYGKGTGAVRGGTGFAFPKWYGAVRASWIFSQIGHGFLVHSDQTSGADLHQIFAKARLLR